MYFPTDEEILEICGSRTAKNCLQDRKALLTSINHMGSKMRIASIFDGNCQIDAVQLFFAEDASTIEFMVETISTNRGS